VAPLGHDHPEAAEGRRAATAQKPPVCLSKPHNDGVTTLPRCPFPGCPVRWHDGPDRECADYANETIRAAADLGIDLTWMTQPPPALDGDGGGYHPSHAGDG
jgi:hypothetical protein